MAYADTDTPFVWGASGEQLTPGQIAARRKVADAMMVQGGDYSPVRSPWQGVARLAQAMLGGYESGQADRAEKANADAERELLRAWAGSLGGGTVPAAAPAALPAAAAAAPVQNTSLGPDAPAAAPARAPVASSAKVWGDDEAEKAGLYEPRAKAAAAIAPAVTPAAVAAEPPPAVRAVASAMNPAIIQMATSPYVSDKTRALGAQMLAAAMKTKEPKETYRQEVDAAGNIWNVGSDGWKEIALKRDKEDEPSRPMTAEERKAYGIADGQAVMMTAKGPKAIGGGGQTVNVNGGGSDKQIFDAFDERAKTARMAASGLTAIQNARSAINGGGGSITGAGADFRLGLQKAAAQLGLADADKIVNTETFRAAIAPQVAAVLKATVGTANISDSDRRFAEKAAGGSIELDKGTINRLLEIMERAGTNQLKDYQAQLEAVYPDPVTHKRERALFGVPMPALAPAAPVAVAPGGSTRNGTKWSVE